MSQLMDTASLFVKIEHLSWFAVAVTPCKKLRMGKKGYRLRGGASTFKLYIAKMNKKL